jgi:predicted TIM-barrel fold metal-dependent hydrolase
MSAGMTPKPPIINGHTHIFIGENIPPQIGKSILPWPLYSIFTIPFILGICRFYYTNRIFSPYCWQFQPWYRRIAKTVYFWRISLKRHLVLYWFSFAINVIIVCHALIFLVQWLVAFWIKPASAIVDSLPLIAWLKANHLIYEDCPSLIKWLAILFTFIFVSTGRKLIIFIVKKAWGFLSILPNKNTVEFIGRYVNIGRFAYYRNSYQIFQKLQAQYPDNTGFVILPMDMEFMGAGKLKIDGQYAKQMADLDKLKQNQADVVFPFVAVDPRREFAGDQVFFEWLLNPNGRVSLKDCFIKDYIEVKKFYGFKIYPALGYYPFDERLLPLWKYAADNNIPITTHCIRGTIYYRGTKEKNWDFHPVFRESSSKAVWDRLLLPEIKNVDYINNFTHPLNYLCLVEEKLLRVVVQNAGHRVKELFGFTDSDTELKRNLNNLKLCFAHYGGDDEWAKYFEKDRDNVTSQLVRKPDSGVVFIQPGGIDASWGTLESIWRSLDWYTIISSMILQYPNLYADISYIVHNEKIAPLLKTSLTNENLKQKILFGTDFYVVRNHKSDKEMLADLEEELTTEEFDAISRDNPRNFLRLVT